MSTRVEVFPEIKVRGRLKAIDEIPNDHFCCEHAREVYASHSDMILTVYPGKTWTAEFYCDICHTYRSRTVFMVAGPDDFSCVDVQEVELDEGVIEAGDQHEQSTSDAQPGVSPS
jgi:hypothetical protein